MDSRPQPGWSQLQGSPSSRSRFRRQLHCIRNYRNLFEIIVTDVDGDHVIDAVGIVRVVWLLQRLEGLSDNIGIVGQGSLNAEVRAQNKCEKNRQGKAGPFGGGHCEYSFECKARFLGCNVDFDGFEEALRGQMQGIICFSICACVLPFSVNQSLHAVDYFFQLGSAREG